jgi:hypothetical protein
MNSGRIRGASKEPTIMSATATAPRAAAALERPQTLDEGVLGMELPAVVSELVAHLGGPNVAIIGGVSKTSLVAEWMRGGRPKSEDRAMRLRLALRLALIVGSRFSDESVRAWFWGANQRLDDEAPIAVIADLPLRKIQKDLLGAARGFVQM